MPYSTPSLVKTIMATSLDDEAILELIRQSDADLDDMLSGAPLSTELKEKCSVLLTAAAIASETQGDPANLTGNQAQPTGSIGFWRAEVKRIVRTARQKDLHFWRVVDRLED